MRNKTISISEDIYDKLKAEENASALIQNLLDAHFKNYAKTEEQILKEVQDKIEFDKGAEKRKAELEAYQKRMREGNEDCHTLVHKGVAHDTI